MEKLKNQKYDKTFLDLYCKENNIVLLNNYENTNSKTTIIGKCIEPDCNEIFSKSFYYLVKNKGYCNKHSIFYGNEKSKQVCLKLYGVEKPQKLNKIKEKSKQTCIKKYGVEHHLKTNYCKEKIKQTNLKKYGVEYISQIKEIKDKIKITNFNKYGVENPMQSNIIKEKAKQTCIEKYGTECSLQNDEIRKKSKQTLLNRYGVENISQNDNIKKLKQQTCLDSYGVLNPMQSDNIKQKSRQTCIEIYGTEHPLQNEKIKQKSKQTCLQRYGVEYPNQNSDIMEKNSKNAYKLKEYIFPSGKLSYVQGYEAFAIDELLNTGTIEEDIINGCKNVPEIWYYDVNGTKRKHYVDIFITSQNKCIEVKSTWTVEKKADSIFLKQQAGKELGYKYEIWVYDKNGEKVECYV